MTWQATLARFDTGTKKFRYYLIPSGADDKVAQLIMTTDRADVDGKVWTAKEMGARRRRLSRPRFSVREHVVGRATILLDSEVERGPDIGLQPILIWRCELLQRCGRSGDHEGRHASRHFEGD
jgi:hypothetical protein